MLNKPKVVLSNSSVVVVKTGLDGESPGNELKEGVIMSFALNLFNFKTRS